LPTGTPAATKLEQQDRLVCDVWMNYRRGGGAVFRQGCADHECRLISHISKGGKQLSPAQDVNRLQP